MKIKINVYSVQAQMDLSMVLLLIVTSEFIEKALVKMQLGLTCLHQSSTTTAYIQLGNNQNSYL